MADMVASAVIQDVESRAISFMFGNSEEQAPDLHSAEGAARGGRRRAGVRAREDSQAADHRRIPASPPEDLQARLHQRHSPAQRAPRSQHHGGRRGGGRREPTVSTGLTTDGVGRFERFTELAGKFLRDVESGCSLRQYSFCNPLARHLLRGKTLRYEMPDLGNRPLRRRFYMWPVCVEGRGVETVLEYRYEDCKIPEKIFHLGLVLRVSESTDIVATAVKCLQAMASLFKVATEAAAGELTLMASNLQCVSDCRRVAPPPWADAADEESHAKYSQSLRPDPLCCKDYCGNNVSPSSELSHTIPEQVILFSFGCYIISAPDQKAAPLELTAIFAPHFAYKEDQPQHGYALEKLGDGVERRYVGVQEVAETVRSKATDCLLNQWEPTGYAVSWIARHGFAGFDVQKARAEIGPQTSGRSRRNSKRRR